MKTKLLLLFICIVIFCSCASLLTSQSAYMKIQKGMTPTEITSLLGDPAYRRFNNDAEEWEYRNINMPLHDNMIIIVGFKDNQVVYMNSFDYNDIYAPAVPVCPPRANQPGKPSMSPPAHPNQNKPIKAINETDFQLLYNQIKKKSFKEDQLELVKVGALNNYFTCAQCVRLMSIYTFDDDKLNVLSILAPRLSDRRNHEEIIKSFSFISSKDKARKEILRER